MMKPDRKETGASASPAGRSAAALLIQLGTVSAILAMLLFIPAGRLDWLQAWSFWVAFTTFLVFYWLWSMRHDPGQLEERSRVGANTKTWDKAILVIYTILLIGMLVLAGLDAGRFHWAPITWIGQAAGWLAGLLAGSLIFWAASVNTYLSRAMRIQEERDQQVISRGPYRWVRHPMYVGVILFMLAIPLMLGSGWAEVMGGLIGVLFVIRTALEDRTLQKELPGYQEYAQRVRYRLIPGLW